MPRHLLFHTTRRVNRRLKRELPAHKSVSTGSADGTPPEIAEPHEPRRLGFVSLSLLAVAVGIAAGLGAIIFRELIGLIHNLLFLGRIAFHYNTEVFTPASPWGPFIILSPVVGAVVVTFLVTKFAPEAKGHGVPEVMDAIYYGGGVIRPVVAAVKSLASAIAIGSGATIGREGPIIQIGSAFGSTLGQIVRTSSAERIILIACGGGGGIAATFNTPIGGVMFAIEILLPEPGAGTFLPVAIATGAATFIGRYWFSLQPAFIMPPLAPLQIKCNRSAGFVSLYGTGSPGWRRRSKICSRLVSHGRFVRQHPGSLSASYVGRAPRRDYYLRRPGVVGSLIMSVVSATRPTRRFYLVTCQGLACFFCCFSANCSQLR
jgi:Voltage gated chloride channel